MLLELFLAGLFLAGFFWRDMHCEVIVRKEGFGGGGISIAKCYRFVDPI